MKNKYLKEFFSLPINLEPITINSIKLYTSTNLKNSYIKAISKNKRTKPILNKLIKLIDKDKIIPCYLDKGIYNLLMLKLFGEYKYPEKSNDLENGTKRQLVHTKAFFDWQINKIIILIDNNLNLVSYINNDILANLTLHECCHMFQYNKPNKFFSIFKNKLIEFYTNFYSTLFSCKIDEEFSNISEEILKFVYENIELKVTTWNYNILKELYTLISKLEEKSDLKKDEFIRRKKLLILSIYLVSSNPNSYVNNLSKFYLITNSLNTSYIKMYGVLPKDNVPIQELYYPSESIAIGCELMNNLNLVYKAINSI